MWPLGTVLSSRAVAKPPWRALLLQVDDPAWRVERGVLGRGLQRGVAGEAVGQGSVCQQALLREEGLCQVSLVAPFQFSWKVVRVPSEQLIPAPVQQDLVLRVTQEGVMLASWWGFHHRGRLSQSCCSDKSLAVLFFKSWAFGSEVSGPVGVSLGLKKLSQLKQYFKMKSCRF